MIRLKLGIPFRNLKKAVERLFCGFLAALVLFVNVTVPVRATGTLATITGAAVISAWLMACGIYPYVTEDGQSFGEWGAGRLRNLWNQYIDGFSQGQTPSGGTKETFDKITGFVTGKTIAVARGFWSELRAFANWIVLAFSVTDNQTGVQLGPTSAGAYLPDLGNSALNSDVVSLGAFAGNYGNSSDDKYFVAATANNVIYFRPTDTSPIFFASLYNTARAYYAGTGYTGSLAATSLSITVRTNYVFNGATYVFYESGGISLGDNSGAPVLPTNQDIWEALSGSLSDFSGVTANTTKVSVPDALPETATYGGLTVPDAISGTAPAITDVIEQGVTDRTQPLVVPTVVEIPADTEITDDGTITENPVVVTPEMALPSVADLSLPASVIAEFKTRFPFCLPWDIMAFLSALSHTAQAPVITCDIPDPFTGQTFTITVDLSPWDDVAAIVRHFESVIIAVGFALGFRRFVLIGAHS